MTTATAQQSYKIIGHIEKSDLVVHPYPVIDTGVVKGDVIEVEGNALIVEETEPLELGQCVVWNSLMKVN